MFMAKKIAYACTGMALCAMILLGCSEDQGKKQGKKIETTQERIDQEAAQSETRATQALQEAAHDTKPVAQETNAAQNQIGGKEKKKLEGC